MMKKTRRTYTSEFKLEAIRLSETSGKSDVQIEQDLGISAGCLWRWKQKFAQDGEHAFPGRGRLTPEQEHIRQLEREVKLLRQERDILKKAVAIFTHPSK
jgi:transposase